MNTTNQTQFASRLLHLFLKPKKHRRNGKVARLPHAIREQINRMIEDGMAYRSIIERLAQGTEPLPHAISEDNLSNWFHGGYRDWRRQQQEKEFAAARAAVPSQPARGFSRSSAIEAEAACTAVACKRRPAEETVEPNHTIPNLIESSNS